MRTLDKLPTVATLRRRVREALDAATDDPTFDHLEAADWYARQRMELIGTAALHLGLSTRAVAGAVAALSPQVGWSEQRAHFLPFARSVQAGEGTLPHPGFTRNRDKAARILRGERPLDVLGGEKVLSFYANLRGDEQAVTVDRHAATVACGGKLKSLGPARYHLIADAYRFVAASSPHTPAELQALVWCHLKHLGRTGSGGTASRTTH